MFSETGRAKIESDPSIYLADPSKERLKSQLPDQTMLKVDHSIFYFVDEVKAFKTKPDHPLLQKKLRRPNHSAHTRSYEF